MIWRRGAVESDDLWLHRYYSNTSDIQLIDCLYEILIYAAYPWTLMQSEVSNSLWNPLSLTGFFKTYISTFCTCITCILYDGVLRMSWRVSLCSLVVQHQNKVRFVSSSWYYRQLSILQPWKIQTLAHCCVSCEQLFEIVLSICLFFCSFPKLMHMLTRIFTTGGGNAHTTFDHRGRQNQHKIPCGCFR